MIARKLVHCGCTAPHRGLTLIEMVISTALVSILLVAALSAVGLSRRTDQRVEQMSRGTLLAEELMAEILTQEYADPVLLRTLGGEILVDGKKFDAILGAEVDENATGNRSLFDDVDDYHGWIASPPQEKDGTEMTYLEGWQRSVYVKYVKADDPNVPKNRDEGAKLITVTVTHDEIPAVELIALRILTTLPTEACCLNNGMCIEVLADQCIAFGGEPQGTGNDCLSDACASVGPLVAHWTCDENAGDTITDEVNDLVGTLHGTGWGGGKFGDALKFDGNNDYAEIPHTDEFLLDAGTFAFWFHGDFVTGRRGLVSKDSQYYDTGGHLFIYLESERVEARLQSVDADYTLISGTVEKNTWYHVALTFGPDGMTLYLDGTPVDTDPYGGGLGTTSGGAGNYEPIALGANSWASGDQQIMPLQDYFDGKIDDFRIFNYALSVEEIALLMSGVDPDQVPMERK